MFEIVKYTNTFTTEFPISFRFVVKKKKKRFPPYLVIIYTDRIRYVKN